MNRPYSPFPWYPFDLYRDIIAPSTMDIRNYTNLTAGSPVSDAERPRARPLPAHGGLDSLPAGGAATAA